MGSEHEQGRGTTLEERSAERRRRMVGHHAASHEDAERWDLEFWQSLTPQDRLSALVAIHQDVEMVQRARASAKPAQKKES